MSDALLVATRKGLFTVSRKRKQWAISAVDFLGDNVSMVCATAFECPDASRAPVQGPAPHVGLLAALRLGRVRRGGYLLPSVCRRTVELDAKMTVIESHITPSIAAIGKA
jgi:hypothetical protein